MTPESRANMGEWNTACSAFVHRQIDEDELRKRIKPLLSKPIEQVVRNLKQQQWWADIYYKHRLHPTTRGRGR